MTADVTDRNPTPPTQPEDAPIVVLCRWLSVLDGWATFYETDPAAANRPGREDFSARDKAQALYLLKERGLQTLMNSASPAIRLGLLEGPPQRAKVWLCDKCQRKARQHNMSPREYAERHGGCENCQREQRDPDFYSLYVLQVDYMPVGRWAFHTPVPLGRAYLPPPRSRECPVVGRRPIDGEGRFRRLGQPLDKAARRRWPEPEVVYQTWTALRTLKNSLEQV